MVLTQAMPRYLPPGKMVLTLDAHIHVNTTTLQGEETKKMPLFCVDIELSGNKKAHTSSLSLSLPFIRQKST